MDLDILKKINSLWKNIFPYLASEIKEIYGGEKGTVLELGAFSGCISIELAKLSSKFMIIIAAESYEIAEYIKKMVNKTFHKKQIKVIGTSLSLISFDDDIFDLLICRGAFFYLDKKGWILKEIFRILKKGGVAIVGGGYGSMTPKGLIDSIREESRKLNLMLGRRWFSKEEVLDIVLKANLKEHCHISEKGGLWLIIKK